MEVEENYFNFDAKFTDILKQETKQNHDIVDRHDFVKLLFNKDTKIIKLYIDLHCVIFELLKIKKPKNFPNECYNAFNKEYTYTDIEYICEFNNVYNYVFDIYYITNTDSEHNLSELDLLSHYYCWYLGVLYGGQMIKKVIPENFKPQYDLIFNIEHKDRYIKLIKNYINERIKEKEEQIYFIDNVNKIYKNIKNIFDEMFKKNN